MTIRVGVVGAGGNARSHATMIGRTNSAHVSAVYDVDNQRAGELADTCNARVCSSLDELVSTCDAVFVCTWTAAHREAVERAAAGGCAIFCEKPLATNLADAQAMAEAVEQSGVVNQIGLPLRWTPQFAVLRRLLADPANGKVLTAMLHSDSPTRTNAVSNWRGDAALSGGGMLIEVGFHDLDVLQWLVSPIATVEAVTCAGQHPGVEDGAAVSLSFSSGAVGALVAVWHDAPDRSQSRRLQVVCERAHYQMEVEAGTCRLNVSGPDEQQRELDRSELTRMATELELPTGPEAAFVDAVENQRSIKPNIADGLKIHFLIDAAYRTASDASHATGRGQGMNNERQSVQQLADEAMR